MATKQPPALSPEKLTSPTNKLSEIDKHALDQAKSKRELAATQAKLAAAQSENADLFYNNIILQLAMKYQLREGDVIEESGSIVRKTPDNQ